MATRAFLRRTSYRCDGCEHVFAAGEVVHRRRRSRFPERGWTLNSYCDDCVGNWHPSWRQYRREPAPCAAGCGVLVSHWYYHAITTCSLRCTEVAARDRRQASRTEKACLVCGESFTPKRQDGRYCSNACRQDAYRQRKAGRLGAE